jgi:hypothetical protein
MIKFGITKNFEFFIQLLMQFDDCLFNLLGNSLILNKLFINFFKRVYFIKDLRDCGWQSYGSTITC